MSAQAIQSAESYSSAKREPVIRSIWRFRELLFSLVARDLKIKYQRSVLGLLWTLVNPLLMVLIFVTIFGSILRVMPDGFWAFFVSGYFAWRFITEALMRATWLLAGHAALRRSVAFPTEIVVLSTMLAKLVEYMIEMAIVLAAIFVFYHQAVPITALLLPYLILLQMLMAAGLMFPLAVLAVLYSDIEHAFPIVIQMLFYLTPIFYPLTMIPEAIRPYFYLNPFAGLIELFHAVLYEAAWPSFTLLGGVTATAIGIFIFGYWIFNQLKDACVEIA